MKDWKGHVRQKVEPEQRPRGSSSLGLQDSHILNPSAELHVHSRGFRSDPGPGVSSSELLLAVPA